MKTRSIVAACLMLAALLAAARLVTVPGTVPSPPASAGSPPTRPTLKLPESPVPAPLLKLDGKFPMTPVSHSSTAEDPFEPRGWRSDSHGFIVGLPGVADLLYRPPERPLDVDLRVVWDR